MGSLGKQEWERGEWKGKWKGWERKVVEKWWER